MWCIGVLLCMTPAPPRLKQNGAGAYERRSGQAPHPPTHERVATPHITSRRTTRVQPGTRPPLLHHGGAPSAQALERRSHDAMRLLRQKYAQLLTQRDGSLGACWSKAEAAFFHVPSGMGGGLNGLLGGLLKSLTALEGLDEEEDEGNASDQDAGQA